MTNSSFYELEKYPQGSQPNGGFIWLTELGSKEQMERLIAKWFKEGEEIHRLKFKIKKIRKHLHE